MIKLPHSLLEVLCKIIELFAFCFAFLFYEVRHAKECQSKTLLWDGSVVIDDVDLWCNIWLSAVVFRLVTMYGIHSSRQVAQSQIWFALSVDLRHEITLCIFLCLFRILIATDTVPVCVYSLPVCYQTRIINKIMMHFASKHN